MPTLPAATEFTGSGITEAQFKTAIANLRGFLADLLGAAGTQAAAQVALQTLLGAGVDARSGAHTVVAGDRGKLIDATGTWTLTLPAAATAGAGFAFALRNSGTGIITIDPSASEQIDGATTITLSAVASCILVCTGSAWVTVGLAAVSYPISVANGGTGSGATPTASNSPQADNIKAVKHDHGHNNVGSLCFACCYIRQGSTGIANYAPGASVPGSYLRPCGIWGNMTANNSGFVRKDISGSLSGTWRLLGYVVTGDGSDIEGGASLFQRIA